MPAYRYDHVHLRSPDPEATARFFEQMFGAEVIRGTYAEGTFYPGQPRVLIKLGGQTVLIAPPHHDEPTGAAPRFPYFGLEHIGLTVDDIDAAVADLRAKGADIAVGPMDYSAGTRLAFIRGPEGVFVEIVQRR
jgi:catechol 2,3-dioxygenase-like lactoylglutathione lyase family enzyme